MISKGTGLTVLAALAVAGAAAAVLYEMDMIGVTGERVVGIQYTPWDTERMAEHADVIIYGTVLGTEKMIKTEIGYHDGTDTIEQVKKMPYQLLRIRVDEAIKGDVGDVITVRDSLDAAVTENGEKIQVRYENSLTYEGGESGIFFIENIGGELAVDGHYGFLRDDGESLRSGFLGADTPRNIVEYLENRYQ